MIVIRGNTKQELLSKIQTLTPGEDAVYLSKRPTPEIIQAVLKQAPNVKTISCPASLYRMVSKKALTISDGAVRIQAGPFPTGRPPKYTPDMVQMIRGQRASGKPAKQIANDSQIPLRTVYYYLQQTHNGDQKPFPL